MQRKLEDMLKKGITEDWEFIFTVKSKHFYAFVFSEAEFKSFALWYYYIRCVIMGIYDTKCQRAEGQMGLLG